MTSRAAYHFDARPELLPPLLPPRLVERPLLAERLGAGAREGLGDER